MSIPKTLSLTLGALLTLPAGAAVAAPGDGTPDTAALAGGLANQQIQWGSCEGEEPPGDESAETASTEEATPMECATIKVPRDWHNPQDGQTFDIAISRVVTVDQNAPEYVGTLFINPGGPGAPGLSMSGLVHAQTPQLHGSYNYIGFDPRGVGSSTNVECTYTYNPDEKYGMQKALAETCGKDPNVQVITSEQTAYDMDFIRHLLAVEKLSYLGYSYGTWLGTWYGSIFGKNADALILDSSTNVMASSLEATFDLQPKARDRQFQEHMMNWIARHDDTYGLGTDPAAIYDRYLAGQKRLGNIATLLWFLTGAYQAFGNSTLYPNAAEVVVLISQFGSQPASVSQNPAKDALQLLNKAKKTPTVQKAIEKAKRLSAVPTLDQSSGLTTETTSTPFYYIACQDGQYNQDLAAQEQKVAQGQRDYPVSNMMRGVEVWPCAFWPTDNAMPQTRDGFPKTIVIQSELDSQTGWEGARESGVGLPNTSFIAVDNESTHGLYPYQVDGVDGPVNNLLLKGEMPKDITVVQGKPVVKDDTTFESWKHLDPQAEHVGEDQNNPRQPVPAPEQASGNDQLSTLIAKRATDSMAEQAIRDIYGEKGVEAINK